MNQDSNTFYLHYIDKNLPDGLLEILKREMSRSKHVKINKKLILSHYQFFNMLNFFYKMEWDRQTDKHLLQTKNIFDVKNLAKNK